MIDKTTLAIAKLVNLFNEYIPCYYEEAPGGAEFQFAVLTGLNGYDIGAGDALSFYLEFYTGECAGDSVRMDRAIDELRSAFDGRAVLQQGGFGAHITFNSRSGMNENSYDLCHRRLSLTARIFFIGRD
jgi:hypothetical protein